MTVDELKVTHPMPWRYVALGGNVILTDQNNVQVPLFVLLDFACSVTTMMATPATAPA